MEKIRLFIISLFAFCMMPDAMMAQERYQVGVCDWMVLKRQKLGEFELAKQLGCDGIEMDMGSLGNREMFDNKIRDPKEAAIFKRTADSLGIKVGAVVLCTLATHEFGTAIEHLTVATPVSPAVSSVDSGEVGASKEHLLNISQDRSLEIANVEGRQGRATFKHTIHGSHFLCIEVVHVNACQPCAFPEHGLHGGDLASVKIAQVEARQTRAIGKHLVHARHTAGVEITQVRDACQVAHVIKPVACTCRLC